jgi:hypothetical protein
MLAAATAIFTSSLGAMRGQILPSQKQFGDSFPVGAQ